MKEREDFAFLSIKKFVLKFQRQRKGSHNTDECVGFACLEFEQIVQMTSSISGAFLQNQHNN